MKKPINEKTLQIIRAITSKNRTKKNKRHRFADFKNKSDGFIPQVNKFNPISIVQLIIDRLIICESLANLVNGNDLQNYTVQTDLFKFKTPWHFLKKCNSKKLTLLFRKNYNLCLKIINKCCSPISPILF